MPRDRRTIRDIPADEISQLIKLGKEKGKLRRVKPIRNCPVCDEEYKQNRPWQKFCSPHCKSTWHSFIRGAHDATEV